MPPKPERLQMSRMNMRVKDERLSPDERPVIELDDEAYDAFIAALDAPAEPNERLRERLTRRPLWER